MPPKCAVNQPQRPPSQHDSMTVWHLGHSRCARTKIGASVVSQYGQRGGSALAGLSSVTLSDCISVPPKCAVSQLLPPRGVNGNIQTFHMILLNSPAVRLGLCFFKRNQQSVAKAMQTRRKRKTKKAIIAKMKPQDISSAFWTAKDENCSRDFITTQ